MGRVLVDRRAAVALEDTVATVIIIAKIFRGLCRCAAHGDGRRFRGMLVWQHVVRRTQSATDISN